MSESYEIHRLSWVESEIKEACELNQIENSEAMDSILQNRILHLKIDNWVKRQNLGFDHNNYDQIEDWGGYIFIER